MFRSQHPAKIRQPCNSVENPSRPRSVFGTEPSLIAEVSDGSEDLGDIGLTLVRFVPVRDRSDLHLANDRDVGRAGHLLAACCLIMELLEPVMDRTGRGEGPAPSTPLA